MIHILQNNQGDCCHMLRFSDWIHACAMASKSNFFCDYWFCPLENKTEYRGTFFFLFCKQNRGYPGTAKSTRWQQESKPVVMVAFLAFGRYENVWFWKKTNNMKHLLTQKALIYHEDKTGNVDVLHLKLNSRICSHHIVRENKSSPLTMKLVIILSTLSEITGGSHSAGRHMSSRIPSHVTLVLVSHKLTLPEIIPSVRS